jgi:hypothetical protein
MKMPSVLILALIFLSMPFHFASASVTAISGGNLVMVNKCVKPTIVYSGFIGGPATVTASGDEVHPFKDAGSEAVFFINLFTSSFLSQLRLQVTMKKCILLQPTNEIAFDPASGTATLPANTEFLFKGIQAQYVLIVDSLMIEIDGNERRSVGPGAMSTSYDVRISITATMTLWDNMAKKLIKTDRVFSSESKPLMGAFGGVNTSEVFMDLFPSLKSETTNKNATSKLWDREIRDFTSKFLHRFPFETKE